MQGPTLIKTTNLSLLVVKQVTWQGIDCGTLPDYSSLFVVLRNNKLEPSSFAETYRYAGQKLYKVYLEYLKGKDHLEELNVVGIIVFQRIFKNYAVTV